MSEQEEATGQPAPIRWITRVLDELGLVAVARAPRDTKILGLQRFVRLFAYGASTLVLASYLSEVGVSEQYTGLFMTLTLVGDVGISLLLTMIADATGRRAILGLGSALMAVSGVIFALTGNYWVLLAAAVFGVITPSGNEIGPFRAIEESTIAHLTASKDRPSVFAWYSLIGNLGTALGLVTCGWFTTLLIDSKGWTRVEAYHAVFWGYAAVGGIKCLLTLLLSAQCEITKQPPSANATETAPLLGNGDSSPKKKSKASFLPKLSRESQVTVLQLCLLFALDNFASGLAPMSWVTYYFKWKFHLAEGKIGTLFFTTSIIAAGSILVAASIAKRIGNIKTMVFTHLPSSFFLAMIGIPSQLPLAMMFVILRACTQSMDTAPRSAFLSAIVLPNERTAVMGIVNVVKTIAQSLGPFITGVLVDKTLFWVAFLAAGCLKATYDIGLLLMFVGHKPREERLAEGN